MATLATLGVTAGFFGKIPARGDFVRSRLPRDFTDGWDKWWQEMLVGSLEALGADWAAAWLQAPVWRFVLPPRQCGAHAVLGVWLPSVDRAGRYYPLTIAAIGAGAGGGFLAEAERAGLAALEDDISPEALAERVSAAVLADGAGLDVTAPDGQAVWWTEGSPLVPAQRVFADALPSVEQFAGMIAGVPAVAGCVQA